MIGILWKTGLILTLAYLGLRWFEYVSVYQPLRGPVGSPPVGGGGSRTIHLSTQDGEKIHAWFITPTRALLRQPLVLLLCHGNGGNLLHRVAKLDALSGLGVHVLIFDYRGYGESTGRPSEQGTYHDAAAAYDWLMKEGFKPEQIIAYGESLGGGIASWVAATKRVSGLILQSTFTSIPDIGAMIYPWLPVRLVSAIHYPTKSRLPDIHVPVLVIHSRVDEVIPYVHGEQNFSTASEPKMFWELHAGHNDYMDRDPALFLAGIKTYLNRYFPQNISAQE